jgi:hypothetical protein
VSDSFYCWCDVCGFSASIEIDDTTTLGEMESRFAALHPTTCRAEGDQWVAQVSEHVQITLKPPPFEGAELKNGEARRAVRPARP